MVHYTVAQKRFPKHFLFLGFLALFMKALLEFSFIYYFNRCLLRRTKRFWRNSLSRKLQPNEETRHYQSSEITAVRACRKPPWAGLVYSRKVSLKKGGLIKTWWMTRNGQVKGMEKSIESRKEQSVEVGGEHTVFREVHFVLYECQDVMLPRWAGPLYNALRGHIRVLLLIKKIL